MVREVRLTTLYGFYLNDDKISKVIIRNRGGNMKEQLLKAILEITLAQQVALTNEDLEGFEALLAQKQAKIEAIERLHQTNPATKEEKHESLLKEIVALDSANNVEFKRQFEEVKMKLQKARQDMNNLRQRQYVNDVYNNPYDISDEEGIFYDKR